MKANGLQKLRDKLEQARDISVISDSCRDCYMIDTKNELINQALASLQADPCKRCGGNPRGVPAKGGGWTTCPDCKTEPEDCASCDKPMACAAAQKVGLKTSCFDDKQAGPGEILKEARALLKAGANEEQWEIATKLREVCDLVARQQLSKKAYDEYCVITAKLLQENNKEIIKLKSALAAKKVQSELRFNDWLIAKGQIRQINTDLAAKDKRIEDYKAALGKLARLGNEPMLGNSIGNVIARQSPNERQRGKMLTIKTAAIKRSDGIILAGRNHAFIIQHSPEGTCKGNSRQGFLTSEWKFVGRVEAGIIAFKAGQTKDDSLLFSEDITNDNPWAGEEINQLKSALVALKEFARHVIRIECWSLECQDGGDLQDLAEKLGLIKQHTATKADIDEESDIEVGDIIYKFADILKGGG